MRKFSIPLLALPIFCVLICFTLPTTNPLLLPSLLILSFLISFWVHKIIKPDEPSRIFSIRAPPIAWLLEFSLLFLMGLTLVIPSQLDPVLPWQEVSLRLYLRALVWLLGLSTLPGFYLLKLAMIWESRPIKERVVFGVSLSLVIVGLLTLIVYFFTTSVNQIPFLFLGFLISMKFIDSYRRRFRFQSTYEIFFSRWDLLLFFCVVASIMLAFSIQATYRYLIPGDMWVSVTAGVEILTKQNVFLNLAEWQYPLMFGIILAGISACTGLPPVNSLVLMVPLTSLNILSFYSLIRVVFNEKEKTAITASIIYAFTGGLAWIIKTFSAYGAGSIWTLAYRTADMQFNQFVFWNMVGFNNKSFALTLLYAFIICFFLATKSTDRSKKAVLLVLASFFGLFVFYVHMIEVIVMPVVILFWNTHEKGISRWFTLAFFTFFTLLIFLINDLFMSNYYSTLSIVKINLFLSTIQISEYFILTPLVLLLIVIIWFSLRKLTKVASNYFNLFKNIILLVAVVTYIAGIYVWFYNPIALPTGAYTQKLTWFQYTTCYGFIGFLALVGIAFFKTGQKSEMDGTNRCSVTFEVSLLWFILLFSIGSFFWEPRIMGYLFPLIAFFAAIGINEILRRIVVSPRISITIPKFNVCFTFNSKAVTTLLIVVVMLLSCSSLIYSANYYSSSWSSLSDDEVRAFAFINRNVPENATVLVPNIYNIYKGVQTISDRRTYLSNQLPTNMDALIGTLGNYNITYALTEGEDESSVFMTLLSYSTLVFQSGEVKIFRFPDFHPPSSKEYSVAVVDSEVLGFLGNQNELGWIDDSFNEGWTYKRVNASSDGEVLTFEWRLHKLYESEPNAIKTIPLVDTDRYPYLIVKYRNTAESMPVTQIITLINETGYPKGFIKNFNLPIFKGDGYKFFMTKLPENQTVAQIWIWMRNSKNYNGTTSLQIDYICFTSQKKMPDQESEQELRLHFLSITLPSLGELKYSIFSNMKDVGNTNILISTYDKSIVNTIMGDSNARIFVFLNITVTIPPWGTEWRNFEPGIISGYIGDRKVIIVGIDSINPENLVFLSEKIQNWERLIPISIPLGETPISIAESKDGLFLSTNKSLYKSTDQGVTWIKKSEYITGFGIIFITSQNWIIVERYKNTIVSKDGGETWLNSNVNLGPMTYGFTELPNGSILCGAWKGLYGTGPRNGIIFKSEDALSWSVWFNASSWLMDNGYGPANHTHMVVYDPFTKKLYATFGDYITGPNVVGGKVTLYTSAPFSEWHIINDSGGPISYALSPQGIWFGPDWATNDVWLWNGSSILETNVLRNHNCDAMVYSMEYRDGILYVLPMVNNIGRNYGIYFSSDGGKTWGTLIEEVGQNVGEKYQIFNGINYMYLLYNSHVFIMK